MTLPSSVTPSPGSPLPFDPVSPPTMNVSLSRPRQDEWPQNLDLDALRAQGWRPAPFNQFILKVHGRCDLACDYCYVYQSPDHSWLAKPVVMTPTIADMTCDRIIEHVDAYQLTEVTVVLHGGEPLLSPPALPDRIAQRLRAGLPSGVRLQLHVQSNGASLTGPRLDRLLTQGYRIGISLDGDAVSHDRHRRYADGRGSFARVDSALRLLSTRPGALAGLLCTVDLANDPLQVFAGLLRYSPPVIDFLLPHGNWDSPPPDRPTDDSTPYGDWLVTVFDHWYDSPGPPVSVRMFEELLALLLGGASRTETIGLSSAGLVVVETDGSLEQVDTLKTAFPGAPDTGLNVHTHSFEAALELPTTAARQIGVHALAPVCRTCPVHRVCGAGYYPHRYRSGTGFRNPSVYCADLRRLIEHARARVLADLPRLTVPA